MANKQQCIEVGHLNKLLHRYHGELLLGSCLSPREMEQSFLLRSLNSFLFIINVFEMSTLLSFISFPVCKAIYQPR